MDDVDNFEDALFESTVCRRIGNHDASKILLVLLHLCLEVVDVHIAAVVALHYHYGHAGLGGTGGVGTVGTGRNQAHIAVRLSLVDMVVADNREAAVFASRARIGL